MSDLVLVAIIGAVPPTLAVLWSHRRIHAVVNSRLDTALELVKSLEAEIRKLKAHPEESG